jgi:hypothetical protein
MLACLSSLREPSYKRERLVDEKGFEPPASSLGTREIN